MNYKNDEKKSLEHIEIIRFSQDATKYAELFRFALFDFAWPGFALL